MHGKLGGVIGEPWEVPGYVHERVLGTGASGTVVRATSDSGGTPVAIKYLSCELLEDLRFRARFRAEARLLSQLRTPHVARFHEYIENSEGAAIVMDLVNGVSLGKALRQAGAIPPEAALVTLKGSLLGLAAAHASGIVHRDYKPENVLITRQGFSLLVDFGIALPVGGTDKVAGTPAYMAPEQWAGRPAGPASDVYAATATFFESITGAKPYSGSTPIELLVQHTQAPIPEEIAPAPLRPLIRRGLAKDPEERPSTAAAFIRHLESIASETYGEDWEERGQRALAALVALFLLAPSSGGEDSGATTPATTTVAAPASSVRPRSRTPGKAALAIGAAAVTVLIGLAGVEEFGFGSVGEDAPSGDASHVSQPTVRTEATAASPHPSRTLPVGIQEPDRTRSSASASASASTNGSTASEGQAPRGTDPSATTSEPTASPAVSPKSTPEALRVDSVAVNSVSCSTTNGIQASITVQTNGAADGILYLTWTHGNTAGPGTPAATDEIVLPRGQRQIQQTFRHTFGSADAYLYWGIRVSTAPGAASGDGTQQTVNADSCDPIH
ncbi:serine/threonine-protein kinase [Streptomyces cacaoi]|uniref:serine/threonine-protein kinase n=1 Tax=Streptomyces cacaoi TaxID=1898 RepID=UPI00374881E4